MRDLNGNSAVRILDAALDLFADNGYEATSIREICEAAGITRPTLYYFFESKEGVHRALLTRAADELRKGFDEGLNSPGDLRSKCKQIARCMFTAANCKPQMWRFILSVVWAINSPLTVTLHDAYRDALSRLTKTAEKAAKAGEIRRGDFYVLMLVMMGSLGEAAEQHLMWGKPKLTPQLADKIIDAVFDGWIPGRK